MTAAIVAFMIPGVFALIAVAIVLRGWAFSILWGWFAVPVFGLPAISIPTAIGLSCVVTMLTHQYVPSKDKDVWMPIVTSFMQPGCLLLIGWIVKNYFI